MTLPSTDRPVAHRPALEGVRTLALRVAREPLVHFLLIGAALFLALQGVRSLQRPTVSLDAGELNQLVDYWRLQAQRPPTADELKSIVRERIDEELLAREAQRLGMDRGDLIIRRRLAQKMGFASEDAAGGEPSEADQRAYFARHADRYAQPTRVALRHRFFSTDRGEEQARRDANLALGATQAQPDEPNEVVGDPSLLPLAYADVSLRDLARDYGPEFVKAAQTAPLGTWVGPVRSPFGWHLIRVESRPAPQPVAFDSVRDRVREDLAADRRKTAADAFLARLRTRYRVRVAGVTQ